jgi:hypothetical protein
MTNLELQTIEFHTKQFRTALENCPKKLLPITFEYFPKGSCGDACLLLAKYLQNMECGTFDYVCGVIKENKENRFQSHAWLQKDGLIIDITADQFEGVENSVIITENSTWYNQFKVDDVHIADYDIYDGYTRASLSIAYQNVVTFINTET